MSKQVDSDSCVPSALLVRSPHSSRIRVECSHRSNWEHSGPYFRVRVSRPLHLSSYGLPWEYFFGDSQGSYRYRVSGEGSLGSSELMPFSPRFPGRTSASRGNAGRWISHDDRAECSPRYRTPSVTANQAHVRRRCTRITKTDPKSVLVLHSMAKGWGEI
jgi:hypothetical protein